MIKVSIDTSMGVLNAIINKIKAFSTQEVAGAIQEDILQNFETSRNVSGSSMKGLAKATIRQKIRKGYPLIPLIATGKLIKSIRTRHTKDYSEVYLNDARGRGITNSMILDFQKKYNRLPFGVSLRVKDVIEQRLQRLSNG